MTTGMAAVQARIAQIQGSFGAIGGVVSGSGPTVAFLTDSPEAALDLCVSLSAAGVAGEVRRAKGPVHGAQVVPGPTARA